MPELLLGIKCLLVAFVLIGALPLLVADYQFLLVGLHFRRLHYAKCAPYFPRTAILIPAWNEAAVIGTSVDRLMLLDYPRDALRIYVVDDASTDGTPEVIQAKVALYPGNVMHLRRDKGGEGKAHTLNHGLAVILADDWMQAILIMDSDVIYERSALRRMTRHLADPRVGSVTAYIKEGSRPGNYMTRFIGYEYITAQAGARRSQEVLGVIACLAGGAQLHSRANIEAVGGRIDTTTLAEDTITTFETQRPAARSSSSRTPRCGPRNPAASSRCGNSGSAGPAATSRSPGGSSSCGSGRSAATGWAASASGCSGSACCCCRCSWCWPRARWSPCTSSTTSWPGRRSTRSG